MLKNARLYAYLFIFISLSLFSCVEQYIDDNSLEIFPHYYGSDLGVTYSPESSMFKVWSPVASSMKLKIYDEGNGGKLLKEHFMNKHMDGTWEFLVNEDMKGKFYTYQPIIEGKINKEIQDPYSYAVGINGNRSAIIDLKNTNPQGWEDDIRPSLASFTYIVLYELHIRDLSTDAASGISNKGKYLGLTETNTTGPEKVVTGLDHLADLGITHLHILPAFDFASLNEINENNKYNWGYEPKNFNVPEGTYATDATDPAVRIKEFKMMVKALHEKGIRVVMDVVYNHTTYSRETPFQVLMPDYFYRQNSDGSYSNGSGCGNELATERSMVSKFIVESVTHWAREYHIDGFRFDLMGLIDINTMQEVSKVLNELDPTIFIYGEGWTGGASSYAQSKRAMKANIRELPGIAVFCDDARDGIRGLNHDAGAKGFVSGAKGLDESVKFGIVGATLHPQVVYKNVNYSSSPWAKEPNQCINYVSSHDDLTLWDKLKASSPESDEGQLIKMQLLANAIVLTSQGIPFLQSGSEFLHSKGSDSNSFESPDSVNQLDWKRKVKYERVYNYYKNLISLRKAHPAFMMSNKSLIQKNLIFFTDVTDNLILYEINGMAVGDKWSRILVAYNGNKEDLEINLPEGNWNVALKGEKFYLDETGPSVAEKAIIPATSTLVLRLAE
ncbi:MAG: type I pullulanase [Bacteroidota bacterium]|nr:type I pullulanase [Bacteroidota bacterium]